MPHGVFKKTKPRKSQQNKQTTIKKEAKHEITQTNKNRQIQTHKQKPQKHKSQRRRLQRRFLAVVFCCFCYVSRRLALIGGCFVRRLTAPLTKKRKKKQKTPETQKHTKTKKNYNKKQNKKQ